MTTLEKFWKELKKERKYELRRAEVKPLYLVAAKTMEVSAEKEHCKIPVKKVAVPADHTIHLSHYLLHPLGHVETLGEDLPKPIDMERNVEYVCFTATKSGTIKQGDLLGYFIAIPLKLTE